MNVIYASHHIIIIYDWLNNIPAPAIITIVSVLPQYYSLSNLNGKRSN